MSLYLNYEKNDKIYTLVNKLKEYLDLIKTEINLPKAWIKKNSLEIEIKKSFIRGLLRYSQTSLKLSEVIKDKFIETYPEKKNIEWISLPYPMVHLPNDMSEDGGFHNDGPQKDFFTCWVPVTNYEYKALSIFNYQNVLIDKISSVILKSGLAKFFSKKLDVNQGNIFFWNAKRIHKGNINSSNNTAVAIQLKLTSDIYEFEQCRNFNSNIDMYNNDQFSNLKPEEIKENYNIYKSSIYFLIENVLNFDELDLVNKVSKKIANKSMHLSFGLSVLAQRILSKKKLFSIQHIDQLAKVIDLVSLSVGSANLISLKRLLSYKNLNKNIEDSLKKVDNFNSIPFNSYQFLSITKKLKKNLNQKNFSY